MFSHKNIGLFSLIPVIIYTRQVSLSYVVNYDAHTTLFINNEILVTGNPDNTKIIDSSVNNFTLTSRTSDIVQGVFSPFNPYPKSAYFNGSSYITIVDTPNTGSLSLSTGDWTIEFWQYRLSNVANAGLFTSSTLTSPAWNSYVNAFNITYDGAGTTLIMGYSANGAGGNSLITLASSNLIPLYAWTHTAIVRSSTSLECYINGIKSCVSAIPANQQFSCDGQAGIGRHDVRTSLIFNGYISDFRITKGQSLYTTNFIPPSASLTLTGNGETININETPTITPLSTNVSLLALQDPNLFVDNSTKNFTLSNTDVGIYPINPLGTLSTNYYASSSNGGSLQFFNGNRYTFPSNNVFTLSTGDFTCEFWIYLTARATYSLIFGTGNTLNCFSITFDANGKKIVISDSQNIYATSLNDIPLNQWTHIAAVRSSGVSRIFTNGMSGASAATTKDFISNNPLMGNNTGGGGVGTSPFYGYISDFRLVKGQVLYTTNFTPPTSILSLTANGGATPSVAPLSSNVSLHLKGANANILDSSLKNNIIVVGGTNLKDISPSDSDINNKDKSIYNLSATAVTITDASTNSVYAVSGFSGLFRSVNSYVSLSANSQTALSSFDFTIEFWAYFINARTTADYQIIYSNFTSFAAGSFLIGKHAGTGGYLSIWSHNFNTGTEAFLKDISLPPNNVWTHYAFVRSGSTFSLYRDGFRVALSGYNGAITGATNPSYIGNGGDVLNSRGFQGNIADFRITKGQALYTSNFTPPSRSLTITDNGGATPSVLPLSSNVAILTLQSQDKTLKDNSVNNFPLTSQNMGIISVNPFYNNINEISSYGTSLFFNGANSSQYITIPTNTQTALSSLDFTIEFWAYFTYPDETNLAPIYSNYTTWNLSSFNIGKNFQTNNHKMSIWARAKSATVPIVVEPTYPPSNKWTHYAFVRTGSTFSIYRDGTLTALSGYDGSITGTTNPNFIGTLGDSGQYIHRGFLSDFRLTKGQALYTTNFTPPTSMLSLTDNGGATPSVLPLSSNVGLLLNNFVPSLTTNNKSIRFPENGFLQIPNVNESLTLGSGDFTIEFKLFLTEPNVLQTVIDQRISAAAQARLLVTINETNNMVVNINNVTVISNTTLPIKKWTKYSIFRNGDILGLAINNTTDNYVVSTIPTGLTPTNGTRIGTNVSTASASSLIGYIDDFKVIKGVTKSFGMSQYAIESLIIAGGGAGGSGGGGGAGGFISTTGFFNANTTYAITVGAGGTAGVTTNDHTNGGDSIIDTINTAYGGGAGGTIPVAVNGITYQGAGGGSGGGSGSTTSFGANIVAGGAGISGQGNNGGRYLTSSSTSYPAAGGGGAGAVGGESSGATAGSGGIGKTSTITGTSRYYSGGGGGGVGNVGGTAGGGGLGGGGNGCTVATPGNATNGTANTGGGGGGRIVTNNNGTNGGSGIVIIRYLNVFKPAIVTGNPTITTSGNYRIYSFTGSGTINIPK